MGIKSDYETIVILELFPHCNMNCEFCYQNDDRIRKYLKKNKQYYIQQFMDKFKESLIPPVELLDIKGGELFDDDNEEYNNLLMECIKLVNPSKRLHIDTNLSVINSCLHKLLFEESYKIELCVSCDAYDSTNINTLLNNLKEVEDAPALNDIVTVTAVITPEMLRNNYDFSILDQLYNNPKLSLCFTIDQRRYPDDVLNNFGERYFNLLMRYPKCENSRNYLAFSKMIENDYEVQSSDLNDITKYCYCERPGTFYMTYRDGFELTENTCAGGVKGDYSQLENSFDCKKCRYQFICADICPSELISNGIVGTCSCPHSYVFDHVGELREKYLQIIQGETTA